MTYEEVIPFLDSELRDAEAWPDVGTKVNEQINLLYIAALSVFKELPLLRNEIGLTTSSSLSTANLGSNSQLKRVTLPADLFSLRSGPDGYMDYGIATFRFDSVDYSIEQAVSKSTILSIGDNDMHEGNVMFAVDFSANLLYTTGVSDHVLYYVRKFLAPTNNDPDDSEDYKVLNYPLQEGNDLQRAIHIVAAHVSGTTTRDPANAQFQALLQEVYK